MNCQSCLLVVFIVSMFNCLSLERVWFGFELRALGFRIEVCFSQDELPALYKLESKVGSYLILRKQDI